MKILLTLIFSFIVLFGRGEISVFSGQDENMQKELQKLPQEEQKIYQNISPSDETTDFEKNIHDPFIAQSSLVLTNNEYPEKAYVGEAFCIILEAKTTEHTNFDFNIKLDKNNDLIFLNPNAKWEQNGSSYKTTLWFEAKTANANLEQIIVELLRNSQVFQEAKLDINPIKFIPTPNGPNFSHLVASSLEVKKIKASYFDNNNIIMMLELNANDTNLKSFSIDHIAKQGIENLKGDFNSSNAFYYAILPSSTTHFDFSYYNKTNHKLENFNLKLKISDEEISTQSDLNPVNKDFNVYKQYTLWGLAFVFAILFIWKKNYFILILTLICFILGFVIDTSTQKAILKEGSRVKILPTEPSTYFYTANSNEEIEILAQKKDYLKILLKSGKIGWINKHDIQ